MSDLSTNESLITSLSCAAICAGLRSILVIDAPYAGLQQIASLLENLLQQTTQKRIAQYKLSTFELDEDVWGSSTEFMGETPLRRIFSPERNAGELQIIMVADLSLLSVTALRSCLMLINADVVHLEGHTEHTFWQPDQCWIASCQQEDIGTVSPHLLDRFALRLAWTEIASVPETISARAENLLTIIPHLSPSEEVIIPTRFIRQLKRATTQPLPKVDLTALKRIVDYTFDTSDVNPGEQFYPRREIALARFAMTLAQIEAAPQLKPKHIERAAKIFGLKLVEDNFSAEEDEEESENPVEQERAEENRETRHALSQSMLSAIEQPVKARVPDHTLTEIFDTGRISSNPYPEDNALVEREIASLKVPFTRYSLVKAVRGPIIGIEKSDTLYDLAIVSTLLEASKKQHLPTRKTVGHLCIEQSDLRRYKRGGLTEHLLLLVLDYTSVKKLDNWSHSLISYLHLAYTERAKISIVQVGAAAWQDATPNNALQAKIISERSILVPRVSMALEDRTALAAPTPLAHGLELALARLRHVLQHGRDTVERVTLVVVSDGRGNVPLSASHTGTLPQQIVTRQGIEDTLTIAHQISLLTCVETSVLYPQTIAYPELPYALGEALGAIEILMLPFNEGTEDEA